MSTRILSNIRNLMKTGLNNVTIQALIVTNHDVHMSEYLAERDLRLKYVSGFSGSAGTAVITEKDALMWTDGRYFTQAAKEMDSNWQLMKVGLHDTPTEGAWLSTNLTEGSTVVTNAHLMPYTIWLNLEKELEKYNITLSALPYDFVDKVWDTKVIEPSSSIQPLSVKFTGKVVSSKIQEIRNKMKTKGVDALILTALDDIAWVLNLRGSDIKFNPVFFAFLIVRKDKADFFVNEKMINESIIDHFRKDNVTIEIHSYESFDSYLSAMVESTKKVWICPTASYHVYNTFPENKRLCECSPVALMKAVKNETEVQGMINAHIKDGIALCRYFSWLEKAITEKPLTEISAANVLESFRKEEEDFVGLSFPTISSSGPNAAIIHYVPDALSDRKLSPDEIYLCDSGAQFLDGTTDVTRTFHFGTPTEFQKECFTRVFKGVFSIASSKFPYGIKGNCLDSFARKALWDVGLDYKHGTGHGIGSYLCVHEGPMGISWRPYPDDPGLQPNMFLSDEPGFYQEGEFGIRIENIVQIVPTKTKYNIPLAENGFLTFDTVTMCPIQTKMLILDYLSKEEVDFLNDYHKKVFDKLGPILKKRGYIDAYNWLMKETAAVQCQ